MIHKSGVPNNSAIFQSMSIRWTSFSNPRPVRGIEGVLYINREKMSISIWDASNGKYIEFFGGSNSKQQVTADNLIVKSTNKNSSYSFSLLNDTLVITDSEDGVILEIPIPNEEAINDKIRALEERVSKLEDLLN